MIKEILKPHQSKRTISDLEAIINQKNKTYSRRKRYISDPSEIDVMPPFYYHIHSKIPFLSKNKCHACENSSPLMLKKHAYLKKKSDVGKIHTQKTQRYSKRPSERNALKFHEKINENIYKRSYQEYLQEIQQRVRLSLQRVNNQTLKKFKQKFSMDLLNEKVVKQVVQYFRSKYSHEKDLTKINISLQQLINNKQFYRKMSKIQIFPSKKQFDQQGIPKKIKKSKRVKRRTATSRFPETYQEQNYQKSKKNFLLNGKKNTQTYDESQKYISNHQKFMKKKKTFQDVYSDLQANNNELFSMIRLSSKEEIEIDRKSNTKRNITNGRISRKQFFDDNISSQLSSYSQIADSCRQKRQSDEEDLPCIGEYKRRRHLNDHFSRQILSKRNTTEKFQGRMKRKGFFQPPNKNVLKFSRQMLKIRAKNYIKQHLDFLCGVQTSLKQLKYEAYIINKNDSVLTKKKKIRILKSIIQKVHGKAELPDKLYTEIISYLHIFQNNCEMLTKKNPYFQQENCNNSDNYFQKFQVKLKDSFKFYDLDDNYVFGEAEEEFYKKSNNKEFFIRHEHCDQKTFDFDLMNQNCLNSYETQIIQTDVPVVSAFEPINNFKQSDFISLEKNNQKLVKNDAINSNTDVNVLKETKLRNLLGASSEKSFLRRVNLKKKICL